MALLVAFALASEMRCGSPPSLKSVATPIPDPAGLAAQTAVAKAEARMAKIAAEQKVYFDAVRLAKLSKTDAVAMFKKDPRWAKVTADKDSIVLKDAPAVAADGDGKNGYSPNGTHVSIDYDHGRLLSAWVTFQERPPDPYKLLAFVGLKGAPEPTSTDDPRSDDRRTGSGLKAFGTIRFEWASGFGPFKHVSTATRLPETDKSLCPTCVISRVDLLYVPKAVYDRWLSQ